MKEVLGNLPQLEGAGGGDFTVYAKEEPDRAPWGKGHHHAVREGRSPTPTLYRWSLPEALQHSLVLHNQTDTA